jgi:hypothetical protein
VCKAHFSVFETVRNDETHAALRDRADFQLLLLDLAMPAEPFARSGGLIMIDEEAASRFPGDKHTESGF